MPGSTTNRAIPYSVAGDSIASFPAGVSKPLADRLDELLYDTGWTDLTLTNTTNFALYTAGEPIRWRRIGDMVELNGVLRNLTAGYIDGGTQRVFATLPAGARPASGRVSDDRTFVCEGSGSDRWCLQITAANGNVSASRFGPGASGTSTWLPFNAVWTRG